MGELKKYEVLEFSYLMAMSGHCMWIKDAFPSAESGVLHGETWLSGKSRLKLKIS